MDVSRPDLPVNVLLDVSAVTPPLSGIGRYALELARHLPSSEGINGIRYLSGRSVLDSFDPAQLPVAVPARGNTPMA